MLLEIRCPFAVLEEVPYGVVRPRLNRADIRYHIDTHGCLERFNPAQSAPTLAGLRPMPLH